MSAEVGTQCAPQLPPGQQHSLEVWVKVPPPSGDEAAAAGRRRLGLTHASDNSVRFYHFAFLYLHETLGVGDADSARLQSMHERADDPRFAARARDGLYAFLPYRHTMLAPAAASWTLGDAALLPVAHLLGIIAGDGSEDGAPGAGRAAQAVRPAPPPGRARSRALDGGVQPRLEPRLEPTVTCAERPGNSVAGGYGAPSFEHEHA
jgi:hypothetical protein